MWNCDWCRWVAAAFFATVLIVLSGRAVAQDSMSALLAVELGELMNSAQLDAVAAKDSEGTDRFVAALAFPWSAARGIGSLRGADIRRGKDS